MRKTLPPIHLACSDDELRPALNCVRVLDGIATATNAHLVAQMNLREYSSLPEEAIKKMSGMLIHKDLWKELMEATLIEVNDQDNSIYYENGGVKATVSVDTDLKFPDIDSVVKEIANQLFDKRSMVAFNPRWIMIAAKLFPSESLICRFYQDKSMMVLFPSGQAKGYVGIMETIISEEESTLDFSLS